jgi:hypothetical protein
MVDKIVLVRLTTAVRTVKENGDASDHRPGIIISDRISPGSFAPSSVRLSP